jgi:crotonobetaine/carnitine-CoA ligase
VVVLPGRLEALEQALRRSSNHPAVGWTQNMVFDPPHAARRATAGPVQASTASSILYTSGTTGRPKGCVLSHRYELAAGAWYASRGHMAEIREGQERLYNPLPQFHVNASILSFFCMMLTGGCQIQAERFQPTRWWADIHSTGATIVHYLGVIVSMLLNQPVAPLERSHRVRFGCGAGVEPGLHAKFEERFGFPLLEIWGMTEMVRVLVDNGPDRQVGTRAFGQAMPGVEVRVADQAGQEVADGEVGEMLVRYSEKQPRRDFFSGYFDDPDATEAAWQGGWFHTGDMVTRDDRGMLHFVDRRKNIIRRAGENIAAAEVEAVLLTHHRVEQVAVMAVDDALREQEVLACVVLKPENVPANLDQAQVRLDVAQELFGFCMARLAYYKAPGYVIFREEIPTTGTQKIQKHRLFDKGVDPLKDAGLIDLRAQKKRTS